MQSTTKQTLKWIHNAIASLIVFVIVLPTNSASYATEIYATGVVAGVQPALLQLAKEEPQLPVRLIVQKSVANQQVEEQVRQLGGQIVHDLSIINAFSVELPAGKVAQLAEIHGIRWVSLDGPVTKSHLNDVDTIVMRNDFGSTFVDGALQSGSWLANGAITGQTWQEIGEGDGPIVGDIALAQFLGGVYEGVRFQGREKGLLTTLNLNAATTASLNLAFRRKDMDDEADFVVVEVSADGGTNWAEISRFAGPATDPVLQFGRIDLSEHVSSATMIRLVTSPSFDEQDKFYIDAIEFEYEQRNEQAMAAPAFRAYLPLVSSSTNAQTTLEASAESLIEAAATESIKTVEDSFPSVSFSNDTGYENWSAAWVETETSTGELGPVYGHVQVISGALRLYGCTDTSAEPSAARQVNLTSGVGSARLSFSFWTSSGVDPSDAVVAEVSRDGGANYTILETFTGITGTPKQRKTYDVSRFLPADFMVRFRVTSNYLETNEYFYMDDLRIEFDRVNSSAAEVVLIPHSSDWKYLDNGSDQGTAWRQPTYNDTGWASGEGHMGYGDGDELTTVSYGASANNKYITTYFRRKFLVTDAATITALNLGLLRDDGAVVYLNDSEVYRNNMPAGTITYNTRAVTSIDGSAENSWTSVDIPKTTLVSGENVLAVEIHQLNPTNSDISFNLALKANSSCVDCINTTNLSSTYVKSIGADQLWNSSSRLQGQSIAVAVVDSGITTNNDNYGAIRSNRVIASVSFVGNQGSVDDYYGHGNHVAGIIAGNGARSNGAYIGVAPRSNLIDVKVTNDLGVGSTSTVVAGLQWILQNKNTYNIRVVNLSLNSLVAESYHTSPLNAALEILWFNGIVVVVSAGNNGAIVSGTLYPPANDPFIITVGATDDKGTVSITDDTVPAFSASGTPEGFSKPDLVAPGRNIVSQLASDDTTLAMVFPANKVSSSNGSTYFRISGTSMASGVVAGAVALLLQDEPNLTPDQVKYRLMTTANKSWSAYDNQRAGAGYLDIYAAVNGTSTQSANTGIAASQLLWTGSTPAVWGSVNWNSVNWNSVNWNSVNWNSVNWNSVNWNSVTWE